MKRKQCDKCPWKVSTRPLEDISAGYSVDKHSALESTIADPGNAGGIWGGPGDMMACHETRVGEELACVGWLANQLGPGNNLALRMAVAMGHVDAKYELVGEQHPNFGATVPAMVPSIFACED